MAQNKKTQKKPPQPSKKITIKEFEWFQVETKVRQLISQLLQPFNKKQTEQTLKINEIKRNITNMTKKLQDHDFLLNQENAQKPTYIQLQDDKIDMLDKKFTDAGEHQSLQINEMKKIIQVYEGKIYQINTIETNLQKQTQLRMKEFKDHKNHINEQVELMLKKMETQSDDFNTLKASTRTTISKLQTKIVSLDNRIIDLEDQIKRKANDIRKNLQTIQIHNERIANHNVRIGDLDVRLADREKDSKLSEKFLGKVVEVTNQLNFIRNFLQFYQPLYTQMQISQTLGSFLKGTQRTRLSLFEEKTLAKMHYSILTLEEDSLESRMADYSNRIKRITTRNKKYLIRMKVEQTVKYGTNTYELREIDENLMQQEQQLTAKPAPVIIPEQEIKGIIEEKWSKLINKLSQNIDEKISPIKTWVDQLQQQALLRTMDYDKKFNEVKKTVEKSEANLTLYKKELTETQKQWKQQLNAHSQAEKKFKDQIKDIINFCSVFNHIVIQDEIDRQGLALYALRGNQAQQAMPNIQLDEKCISCSNGNSSAITNQAFKMACLAYNPSQIRIEDKIFSRQEILQISTNILDRLKKKIENIESGRKPEEKKRSRSTFTKNIHPHHQMKTIDTAKVKDMNNILPSLSSSRKKRGVEKEKNNISVFY